MARRITPRVTPDAPLPFDPRKLDEAIQFLDDIVEGKKPDNPNNFPTDPYELAGGIQQIAWRVNKLDKITAKMERIIRKTIREFEAKPSLASSFQVTKARPLLNTIRAQYEPVPKDADFNTTLKTGAKIFFESMTLGDLMSSRNMSFDRAEQSKEFQEFQNGLNESIEEEMNKLKDDPLFQRYKEDFPLFADMLFTGFLGVAGAINVPIRETLTMAQIAAEDPKVWNHAMNFKNMLGGEAEDEFNAMLQAGSDRIERAIFSKELKNKRFATDFMTSMALTSPVFLAKVGLPTNLPRNLILDGLRGIKNGAKSLEETVVGNISRDFINYFRDRRVVQSEGLRNALFERLKQMLGNNAGDDIVKNIQDRFTAELDNVWKNMDERIKVAERIFKGTQDHVRSIFQNLDADEKLAVLYRTQGRRDLASKEADALFDTPNVVNATAKVKELLDNLAKINEIPVHRVRSDYWPAFRAHIEGTWDALKKAALEPAKRERIVEDVVVAGRDTVDERIDDLVFGAATPMLNAMQTQSSENAMFVATIFKDVAREYIDNPTANKVVADALADVPIAMKSILARHISAPINLGWLGMRVGSWTFTEALDRTFNQVGAIIARMKRGEAVSFRGLFRNEPLPPDIVADTIGHAWALDSIRPWRVMSWFKNLNDATFTKKPLNLKILEFEEAAFSSLATVNKMQDKFSAKRMFNFFFDSNKKQLAREAGTTVDNLPKKSIDLAREKAIKESREWGLSYSFSSAFTTSVAGSALFPYFGFFTKMAARTARTLGEVPEMYKATAFMLNKVREMNREYGNEFRKEVANIAGHKTPIFRKLPIYFLLKPLADSYFGEVVGREEELERDIQILENIEDPEIRRRMLDNNPPLREYMAQRPWRGAASFFESVRDMQAIPIGPVGELALRKTELLEERTPFWIPGQRQMTNLFTGLGLFNPEGFEDKRRFLGIDPTFLNKRAQAYQNNLFDADVATELLLMKMRGEDRREGELLTADELGKIAKDRVRTRYLKDWVIGQFVGLGQQDIPEVTELWNRMNEANDRKDLFLPPPDVAQEIQERTGIEDRRWIDKIYRHAFIPIEKAREIERDRIDFLKNFPGPPDMDPAKRFSAIQRQRKRLDVEMEARDEFAIYKRWNDYDFKDLMPTHRNVKALFQSYNSREITNDEGETVGIEIDWSGKDKTGIGTRILQWQQFTPKERLDHFKKQHQEPGVPASDNAILRELWPWMYDNMRDQAPEVSPPDGVPVDKEDKHLLDVRPEPVESESRKNQFKPIVDIIKELRPGNFLEFPSTATQLFLRENPEIIEKFKKKSNDLFQKFLKATEKLPSPIPSLGGEVEAATSEQIRTADEILREGPRNPIESRQLQRAEQVENEIAALRRTGNEDDLNKAIRVYRDAVQRDPFVGALIQRKQPYWGSIYGNVQTATQGQGYNKNLRRSAINYSLNQNYVKWMWELKNLLRNPFKSTNSVKEHLNVGKAQKNRFGDSFIDILRFNDTAAKIESDMQADGHRYALGNYTFPDFPEGEEAARNAWFDIAYMKPGESRPEYEKRIRNTIQNELSGAQFDKVTEHVKEKGNFEAKEFMDRIKQGTFTRIPLDRFSQERIQGLRDELPFIEHDPFLVQQRLGQDPDLVETIKNHEPRFFNSLENKVFGDLDKSALRYLQASNFNPNAIEYLNENNPNTMSRLYYTDDEVRTQFSLNGIEPPIPTAEVSTTRDFVDAQGNRRTVKVPSILSDPEPLAPTPIPRGGFSNFPAALQTVTNLARADTIRLARARARNPDSLSPSQRQFLNSSQTEKVFRTFPRAIGQAFREGELGPDDVVNFTDQFGSFANSVGAISNNDFQQFSRFINNTKNVLGATQFGFELGNFLDKSFNIPRTPIRSEALQFLLAGRPISNQTPVNDPINQFAGPVLPAQQPFGGAPVARTAPTPGPVRDLAGSSRIPVSAGPEPATGGPSAVEQGAPSVASLGSFIPGIGPIFAGISAGLSISNIIKGRKSREKAKERARKRKEEIQRQIELQRAIQQNRREVQLNRRRARQRLRQLQRQQQEQERDFQRRLGLFLKEPNFATLGTQPQEFQDAFIDRFEPQAVEFARRPTFRSRVGLISSIESSLPNPRF